jgi:predicted NUDIX family phosphoesterase
LIVRVNNGQGLPSRLLCIKIRIETQKEDRTLYFKFICYKNVMDKGNNSKKVLLIPKAILKKSGYFQGISFEIDKYLPILLNPANWLFIEKVEAETLTEFKQLIPYVVCIFKDNVFTYRRSVTHADPRLTELYSIGLGGHISKADFNINSNAYQIGFQREIREEVKINCRYSDSIIGIINDDSNDIGKMHIGIIHLFSLERKSIIPLKETMLEAKFLSKIDLIKRVETFEAWSQICINNLDIIISKSNTFL